MSREKFFQGKETISCAFFFAMTSIMYIGVMARMPALKLQLDLNDTQVGFCVLFFGIGSLFGLSFCNWVLRYWSSRTILRLCSSLSFLILAFLGFLPSISPYIFFCTVLGFCMGLCEVAMNVQAILIEHRTGRPCTGLMQAAFSIGCILGSCISSFFASQDCGPGINFAIIALVLWIVSFFAVQNLADNEKTHATEQKDSSSKIPFFIILCGIMCLCSYASEGVVVDWGSILLHESKGVSESIGALSGAIYNVPMFVFSLLCDRIRLSISDNRLLFVGGSLATFGIALCIFTASPWLTILGFFLIGIGATPTYPIAMSRAGTYPNVDATKAASIVSITSYLGLLLFPPLIGFVSNTYSLEKALLIPLFMAACLILGSFFFVTKKS